MTRRALPLAFVLALACTSDRTIDLEVHAPRDGDGGLAEPGVRTYELRLYRLADGERCPDDAAIIARAAPFAELAHVQAFAVEAGMGAPIGEVPEGRWAIAVVGRDAECAARTFGCEAIDVGPGQPLDARVELAPLERAIEGCGACRACVDGACEPGFAECR